MKHIAIIILMLSMMASVTAQTVLPADSHTAYVVLRKHLKAKFLRGCIVLTGKENPDSVMRDKSERDYGDFFIHQVCYAFGDWALTPDFNMCRIDIQSIWPDFEFYKIGFPEFTSRNDSIVGFYSYRDRYFGGYDTDNPLYGDNLIAYNHKSEMVIYLDWPNNVFFHWSTFERYQKNYPNLSWRALPVLSKKQVPLLSPKTRNERKKLLVSELMKNIYSYRLMKSGILDSLRDENNRLKENAEQFPLLDSLIPDFDENLFLRADVVKNRNEKIEYWRFEYPGYDSLYSARGSRRSKAWEKYWPLKRQYYVVGFELERELVHFISGDDFYKTPFANCYLPYTQRDMLTHDSASFATKREWYVEDRMSSLFPDLYFTLRHDWGVESCSEDEKYWYFILHSVMPYNKTVSFYDDFGNKTGESCCLSPYNKFCDYRVRMSKLNWELVEIVDTIKCNDSDY